MKFNGKDDMIVVGGSPTLDFGTQASYSVWVKFDQTPIETGHSMFRGGTTTQGQDLVLEARNWNGQNHFDFDTNTYTVAYGTSQPLLADIAGQLNSLIAARGGLAAPFRHRYGRGCLHR